MSDRAAEEHVPLPPPVRKEGERSSSSEDGDGKRKERRRKGKSYDKRAPLVHNPLDEDYPVIEDTSTPSSDRRDSGVFSGRGSPRNAKYHETKGKFLLPAERRSPVDDSHVQELTQQFNHILQNEHLDKLNAEARANRLEEQLNRAKAEIDQNKRADYLDQRERRISDREKSHRDEQKRLSQTSLRGNLPPPRRDVVVTQPQLPIQPSGGYYATPPPAADPAAEALAKAKSDWNKRKSGGGYGDRRRSP
ncbi:uncharacterized protein HMPREF1541_10601 [Cyphellophora europaea CBS 101466]|uniref:Uncharacterized protein n=1 Tax=Cyphellophora europaea (strain CBS 101466) TaxID=1220924 RepID=W2S731_CYPE1|nr:uncharacterized protein HMPREF1541_10601 [Cyphellophora europaea CBS 101466]ETN44420.1 hypothetical protein HMPREF1541_10601 [Cyphellophora europaea CBS 101466]